MASKKSKSKSEQITIPLLDLKWAIIYLRHQAVTIKRNHHQRRYWQDAKGAEDHADKLEDYEMEQRAKK